MRVDGILCRRLLDLAGHRKCNLAPTRDGAAVVIDRFREVGARDFAVVMAAEQVQVVRLHVLGRLLREARLVCRRQSRFQRLGNVLGDFGLNGKNVFQLAIVCLGPELLVGGRIDQLRYDAQPRGGAPHAPLDDVGRSELRADLRDGLVTLLVAHDGGSRDGLEASNLRELRDDVLGDAIDEVLVFRIGAHVLEWQHGDELLTILASLERRDRDGGAAHSVGDAIVEGASELSRCLKTVARILGQCARDRLLHGSGHVGS